jgi:hypothetical protein
LKPWQLFCWNALDPNRKVIESVGPIDPNFSQCLDVAGHVISGKVPNSAEDATHQHAEYIAPRTQDEGAMLVNKVGAHSFYKDAA